jgi:hypothetical protein
MLPDWLFSCHVMFIQWAPLNWMALGQTITDPNELNDNNNKIYLFTKYAIERHYGLVQSGSL